jgi:hypothetical protein
MTLPSFPVQIKSGDGTIKYADTFPHGIEDAISMALASGLEQTLINRLTNLPVLYLGKAETDEAIADAEKIDVALHKFIASRREEYMGEAVRKGIINGTQGVDLLRLWHKMDEVK